jgi:hypothetical protein
MNDARNVRRSPKMSYTTIRNWGAVTATMKTCSIPPNPARLGGVAVGEAPGTDLSSSVRHACWPR